MWRIPVALLALIAVPAGLILVAVGGLGWGVAGVCDTNCPSDGELLAYRVMFWSGAALLAGAMVTFVALVRWWLRARREERG
jgi:hypothetical protein